MRLKNITTWRVYAKSSVLVIVFITSIQLSTISCMNAEANQLNVLSTTLSEYANKNFASEFALREISKIECTPLGDEHKCHIYSYTGNPLIYISRKPNLALYDNVSITISSNSPQSISVEVSLSDGTGSNDQAYIQDFDSGLKDILSIFHQREKMNEPLQHRPLPSKPGEIREIEIPGLHINQNSHTNVM